MYIKTDAVVIKEQTIGESDRLVTLLTRNSGVIRAFARKAKSLKDSKSASTGLLAYSDFSIYKGKDKYIVDSAELKDIFFNLRSDIVALSLAQYFCELAFMLVPEETDSEEYLRIVLNSLHFLSQGKKHPLLLKAVTELRMLAISGYMPDLIACKGCSCYENEAMYFVPSVAAIYCEDCFDLASASLIKLSMGALTAMRHICYVDFNKLYSFSLPENALKELSTATERYLTEVLGRIPPTLDFYKTIAS